MDIRRLKRGVPILADHIPYREWHINDFESKTEI